MVARGKRDRDSEIIMSRQTERQLKMVKLRKAVLAYLSEDRETARDRERQTTDKHTDTHTVCAYRQKKRKKHRSCRGYSAL